MYIVNKIISTNLEIRTLIIRFFKKKLNHNRFSNKSMQFISDPTVYSVLILYMLCCFI